jgi:hypothetical protein
MTSADRDPHPAPSSVPHVVQLCRTAQVSFWIRELPFTLVLILTIAGVAYTSFSNKPIVGYPSRSCTFALCPETELGERCCPHPLKIQKVKLTDRAATDAQRARTTPAFAPAVDFQNFARPAGSS